MTNKLWEASLKEKKNSNLYAFEKLISKKTKKKFNLNYKTLLNWTVKNSPEFWNYFWEFSKANKFEFFFTIREGCQSFLLILLN